MPAPSLHQTPLHSLHLELGASMVEVAGYDMPGSYPEGAFAEHRQCRESAVLFDLSHVGQLRLVGAHADEALESLGPMDVVDLAVGALCDAFLTHASGGILDRLTVTKRDNGVFLWGDAARGEANLQHLQTNIGHRCTAQSLPDRALLSLQGPKAAQALAKINAEVATLAFMTGREVMLAGAECFVTRSGHTGEDGFEISLPSAQAGPLARALLTLKEVKPAGLDAHDTLRLEAGICLVGQDVDATTTPVEANLAAAIPKVRQRDGARHGGYPGYEAIDAQLMRGAMTLRVGLLGLERVPVRQGAVIVDSHGHRIGHVTSGTLSPTLGQPIAMAYLIANHALPSHEVYAEVGGQRQPMRVGSMPFVPDRHFRD